MLGAGKAVGQLANSAFVILLAADTGHELCGSYSFAMALGAVMSVFVSLGGVGYSAARGKPIHQ